MRSQCSFIYFISYLTLSIRVSRTDHNFIYISQKPYECDDDIYIYETTNTHMNVLQFHKFKKNGCVCLRGKPTYIGHLSATITRNCSWSVTATGPSSNNSKCVHVNCTSQRSHVVLQGLGQTVCAHVSSLVILK